MNHIFIKVSNVAFSNDLVTKKSIKGYLFTLFKGLIDWQLIEQRLVIKLSIKAELLALLYAATELI